MSCCTRILAVSATSLLWAVAACSSPSRNFSDASTDAPTDAGPATDAPPGCHTLVNTAPRIGQQYVAGEPPTPAGGTITDGTYFVTAATIFTAEAGVVGPTGAAVQETNVISGTTFKAAISAGASAGSITQTGAFTTNGTAIAITVSCPPGTPPPPFVSYDSDGRSIRVYSARSDAGLTSSFTFSKQ